MQVLGHRGVMAEGFTENTWEAFGAAADLGVDGIETDARLTADGQLVLFHDRLCATGEPVAEVTRAALEKAEGHAVPELGETLDRWPHLLWNLELKAPDLAAPLMAVLAARDAPNVVLSSFFHNLIHDHPELHAYPIGLIIPHRPVSVAAFLGEWTARPLDWCVWNRDFVDETILTAARDAGITNVLYNLHTQADLHQAESWPVSGVIMDQPELALERGHGGSSRS
ncbi:MAG TPA: glycerophosphodiester phosphodiesterase [Gammaproteobacteria bacterium]|nr:glycerophosphodiester phosphodiesterase [Gammaproteobacteria bacterium]